MKVQIQNNLLEQLIDRWVSFVREYPVWILMFFGALTAASFYYAAGHLGVNADTAEMFPDALEFRKNRNQFDERFPNLDDTLVAIIEANIPEESEAVASELIAQIRATPELFKDVFHRGSLQFFRENGLLFLNENELYDVSLDLAKAQPFLGPLIRDPSLQAFFRLLTDVAAYEGDFDFGERERLFEQLDAVLHGFLQGVPIPFSWRALMESSDEQVSRELIVINPVLDFGRLLPAKPAIEWIRDQSRRLKDKYNHRISIRITGDKALSFEEMQSATAGATRAAALALILVSLTLWIGLRSWKLIAATLIALLIGLLITAGFAAVFVERLNMISVAFAVLYIGLGVDYAIHLCLYYRELVERGESRGHLLNEAARDVGKALILCSLSTAVGFYAFVPTDFSGVSELGLIAGTGMFVSLIVSLSVIPALLTLIPLSPATAKSAAWVPDKTWNRLAEIPKRWHWAFKAKTVVLLIASLAFLPYVYFDYDPLNLRDPESESVATLRDLIASGLVNPWAVSFTTDSQESVQTLSAEIRELDSVDRVVSALDLIPDDQREKLLIVDEMRFLFGEPLFETVLRPVASPKQVLATISEFRAALGKGGVTELSLQRSLAETVGDLLVRVGEASPEDQRQKLSELQDTLLGYFPLFMQSLRDSLNADVVTMDSLPDSLRARWVTVDGAYRVEVSPDASLEDNGELREFADDVRAVKGDVTGDLISTIESGDLVVRAFQQGFVSAFVLVAVLLVVFLQSIRSTFLVLLPLMLAGSLTVASTVVLDLPFNFANILALPLLLGLGVDNGIHIVQRARGHHYSESALLKTSTARAIFFSALTTIFSFGNLVFSPHPGTASMGILLTLGVLFTLFATLVILPAFLHNPRGSA